MKSIVYFCTATMILLGAIKAATITGSFTPSSPGLESINLSEMGTLNWATLERTGFANTKAGGASAFSNVQAIGGSSNSILETGIDASTQMSWTDGAPIEAVSGYRNFAFSYPWDIIGAGVSFQYTLQAAVVDMRIYLIDYDGDSDRWPDRIPSWPPSDPRWVAWNARYAPSGNNTNLFTANLSSGATFSQVVTLGDGFDSDHGKGWFDLTVSGSVGDVITISHILERDELDILTNVGIQAVAVRAIPEPGTILLCVISVCFGIRRRRVTAA